MFVKTLALPVPTPSPCLFHGQVWGLPHPQTILLYVLGTHLSMLIAQRFKMLAVHIMTSMVTKISQQMRLKVQTPPVTCISNHKAVSLALQGVLIDYV